MKRTSAFKTAVGASPDYFDNEMESFDFVFVTAIASATAASNVAA
jgi:hypothetical protein